MNITVVPHHVMFSSECFRAIFLRAPPCLVSSVSMAFQLAFRLECALATLLWTFQLFPENRKTKKPFIKMTRRMLILNAVRYDCSPFKF